MLNPSLIFLIHQKLSVMSPNSTLSLSRDVNLWVQNRCFDILPFTHLQTFSLLVLNLKTQKHLHFAQSQSHRIFDLEIAKLESSSIFLRRLSLPFACSFDTSAVRRVVDWSVVGVTAFARCSYSLLKSSPIFSFRFALPDTSAVRRVVDGVSV